jgi:transcriptional regulator with XRE-family HTH domain
MKKTKDQTSNLKKLKKEVGERFKVFRLDKKKAQHILASELQVHQSTITNIEKGITFPKVSYLSYFFEKYGLNLNWMVCGYGGQYMEEAGYKGASRIMGTDVEYDGYKYEQYRELNMLMQIPVIEQVIMAKLSECKILFEDKVNEFLSKQTKEKSEKKRKASRAKVKK